MATSIPPHNAAEVCDAALKLDRAAGRGHGRAAEVRSGTGFPTGGVVVDGRETIREAMRPGGARFECAARWEREEQGRGGYVVVVTEIPYQVQKSRLIEKIADLLTAKRLRCWPTSGRIGRGRAHRLEPRPAP